MKLYTLIENHKKLEKAEVEVILIPGIPQIHFLGLPDKAIKESFLRIKSALKSGGFKFPVSHQVIVNIKPSYLKKSSKGVELAVALALLNMTDQSRLDIEWEKAIVYGELSLDGDVFEPIDLWQYQNFNEDEVVVTGQGLTAKHHTLRLLNLKNQEYEVVRPDKNPPQKIRPAQGVEASYNEEEAEFLFLMATTRMHSLLAGTTGAGKTTLLKNYQSFTPPSHQVSEVDDWCSVVMPHHSVTPAAFLGGGSELYEGELERVKDGLLILDEFLEFNTIVLETLRGPMTGEKLRLSRGGHYREYNCQFQVLATTNLCPCGKKKSKMMYNPCRFSVKKCNGYLDKLSGPILDRFGLIYLALDSHKKRPVKGLQVLKRLENYTKKLELLENQGLKPDMKPDSDLMESLYPEMGMRRRIATIRAAKVYAIERESSKIDIADLGKAEKWTYQTFMTIESGLS